MEFFDKKQEVLEVKLTPYGRYKLSKGRFKPTYYAFFDEGVLYNSRYSGEGVLDDGSATGGFVEKQNEIESRIQDNTAMLKTLNVYSGIQTSQLERSAIIQQRLQNADISLMGDPLYGEPGAIYAAEELQPVATRAEFLSRPLGKSKISHDKQPSWAVNCYAQEISSSTSTRTRSYTRPGNPPLIAATAISAINTTGVKAAGNDCSFTITIPAANGGDTTGGAGAITIFLDASAALPQDLTDVDNQISIGIGTAGASLKPDSAIRSMIMRAINGTPNPGEAIRFPTDGRGQSGVSGISAYSIETFGKTITLGMVTGGTVGNITSALANVSGVSVVQVTAFTAGAAPDIYQKIEHIPQINISCKYNTYIKSVGGGWSSYVVGDVSYENPAVLKDSIFTTPTETNTLQAITTSLINDIYVAVEHKALVLGIGEENTDFDRENFEIEVFLSGAAHGTSANGYLKQLRFRKDPDDFYDDDDVGHYLAINNDEEINPELLRQLGINNIGLLDPETGAISTRQFFVKDLYGPADDLCPPEESE
jgi:hypothetical protein